MFVSFYQLIRNQRGIAFLYMVVIFTLLGVLISFGARKLDSLVTQGKTNDTKAVFERSIKMLTAWSVANGRLATSTEYPGVFGATPQDAWGKPVVFSYYSSLTKTVTGGLCGLTSTAIKYNGQDVAFLLLSGGGDMSVTSTSNTDNITKELNGLKTEDLFRIVTLKELQEQASCFGTTQGKFRIVNNELPNICKRQYYSATIIGDGGVPPYASYTFIGLPSGLASSGATIFGISSSAKGSYPVGVTVTDSAANAVKRSYILNIMSSCY